MSKFYPTRKIHATIAFETGAENNYVAHKIAAQTEVGGKIIFRLTEDDL